MAATSPDDYEEVNMDLAFSDGTAAGTPKCVDIRIVLNAELEEDEQFTVVAIPPSPSPASATVVTIRDGMLITTSVELLL